MIHSTVTMHRKLLIPLLACLLALSSLSGTSARAQQTDSGEIIVFSPLPGEAVQGLVQIIGTVDPDGFQSYQIAFAFQDDATQTWFQIAHGNTPVIQGVLAEWDTTVLTDSTYNLLLRVTYQNGSIDEMVIENIRVRNYSTIETATPAPTSPSINEQPTATLLPPTETPVPPTPTPLPPNPAAVDFGQLTKAMRNGSIFGVVVITITLLYLRTKQRSERL